MVLLRRVLGDALRARRQAQHRTLREVSSAANVSLGYLSEIERGQKEASSELLSAICDALGAQMSEVLREVSEEFALAELTDLARAAGGAQPAPVERVPAGAHPAETAPAAVPAAHAQPLDRSEVVNSVLTVSDGPVSVAVHHDGPLKTTLRTRRTDGHSLRVA
jgi:transcriptional regulator with XRE-family HTH domain